MRSKSLKTIFAALTAPAIGAAFYLGCSGEMPATGSSPVDQPATVMSSSAPSAFSTLGTSSSQEEPVEEFNCTNVEKTNVRFGHPGYTDYNRVGLFAEFQGVADGALRLQVWWDYDNRPEDVDEVPLEDGDVYRDGEKVHVDKLIEHVYEGLTGPTERAARIELIQEGQTGNCARVRRTVVEPPPAVAGGKGTGCVRLGFKFGSGSWGCPAGYRMPNAGEQAKALACATAADQAYFDYFHNIATSVGGCNCKWNGGWCGQPSIETFDGRMCGDFDQLHVCVK